ncbi:MAG: DUF3021 domain-containing protein [Defluviitaleaceae bacterium]|nr:DUF3021 domain-containing protein [Defluviitaleaceae bacterium]
MIKLILKYLMIGIAAGCIFFVGNIIFHDSTDSGRLHIFLSNPAADAIGFIVVGIGFFGGGFVHEIERLRFSLKVIIHIIIGISLFLIVSLSLGWISLENRFDLIISIGMNVVILLVVWTALYFWDKKEIRRANRALKERDSIKPFDAE